MEYAFQPESVMHLVDAMMSGSGQEHDAKKKKNLFVQVTELQVFGTIDQQNMFVQHV